MNKHKYIWIYSSNNHFYNYLIDYNIIIFDSKKIKDVIVYKVDYKSYCILKKFDFLNINVYSYNLFFNILHLIKNNFLAFLIFNFFFINVYILSNVIVSVDIVSSDHNIVKLLYYELDQYNLKRLTFAKNYDYLQKVKEKILDDNKNSLEWIDIKRSGMKYIIYTEKRVIKEEKKTNNYCHIVAKREGIIDSISIYEGISLVDINDKVNKGDVLVSGDLIFKDKLIGKMCASADIYANTWYTIKVNAPIYYYEKKILKNHKYNLVIGYDDNKYPIFKDHYKNNSITDKLIFNILGFSFYIRKENEVNLIKKKYSYNEILDIASKTGLNKLNVILDDNSSILQRNVLKKYLNDSKMYLELFVSVKENIGMVQIIE